MPSIESNSTTLSTNKITVKFIDFLRPVLSKKKLFSASIVHGTVSGIEFSDRNQNKLILKSMRKSIALFQREYLEKLTNLMFNFFKVGAPEGPLQRRKQTMLSSTSVKLGHRHALKSMCAFMRVILRSQDREPRSKQN